MPGSGLRVLALDGGGVRGLSSLMILKQLMSTVDPDSPPKPCDYFDMIGGTSTGGLIAIMLGRLQMTVDQCIAAYTSLSDRVFEKKSHRVNIRGRLQGRFDAAELERAVTQIVLGRGHVEDALLKDSPDAPCRVFVCATSKQTGDTVCLTSYRSPRGGEHLLDSATIWQACRATSAATSFFDPIAVGPFEEEFVDGALGANNPVSTLWNQAKDVWGDQLQNKLKCLVSIGTGVPSLKPVHDDVLGIWATLKELATETEKTAEQFRRDKSNLDDEGRYYRFNVDHGLEDIGLEESKKKKEIAAATGRYVASQSVFKEMKACASSLAGREYHGPYRTVFTLQGVPTSNNFVDRPTDTTELEKSLLPHTGSRSQQRRFVLYGLGGIGETQLAVDFARRHQATFSSVFWLDGRYEDRLRQSLACCARRIPQGQIPDRSRKAVFTSKDDLSTAVADVLAWLGQPDNVDWLLIFDNVDQDYERDRETRAYDVRQYLPGDHGSVLITTRLSRLAQLGNSRQLGKVDTEFSMAIFQKWRGRQVDDADEVVRELLGLLDGLPLALAQAASYLRETELDTASYLRLYKQQWSELMASDSNSDSPLVDYQRSIATTWTISFQAVEARNRSAADLVRLWAFLDNRDLWHGLIRAATDVSTEWPKWLYEMACSEVRFLDAARLLLRYSMIEAQESVPGSYSMHPVVHTWTSHILVDPTRTWFMRLAVVIVGSLVPRHTAQNYWVLQRRLLPHAERCVWWRARGTFNDIVFIDSQHMIGNLYFDQGKLKEAEAMYQRALEGSEQARGPDHTSTLGTVNNLGLLYFTQGRLKEAEAMYQRALKGFEKALGPDHTSTLGTVNNLGILYFTQARLKEAEAMYRRALEGFEKALGPDHTSTLGTEINR
ncbi:acyl transferase/acyl hydrolase/lysophospholipase [Diplogelasinospora grovesii]|uniref:Acyl transferase/acyl hydrolase/lysophospholipase n=1 Tax=Diplogelasinospora grovesii TaxID=303347 RepID=A0AAN6MZ88_9PEZI|nr:acyl transferase/acyl hydrolase/lysophospholipase [Diplogelasinospora grovesii]